MADNTTLNAGTGGDVIASDDIAGVKHQLVKVEYGAADSATQVSAANPLPVASYNKDGTGTALTSSATGTNNAKQGLDVTLPSKLDTTTLTITAGSGTRNFGPVDTLGYAWWTAGFTAVGSAPGAMVLQGSHDNSTWFNIPMEYYTAGGAVSVSTGSILYIVTGTSYTYNGPLKFRYMRVQTTGTVTGTYVLQVALTAVAITRDAFPVVGSMTSQDSWSNPSNGISSSSMMYAYSGGAILGWDRVRVANLFKSVLGTATGSTALWTPTSGKKFRLMKYKLDVPNSTIAASAADLTITFLDSATATNVIETISIPATTIGGMGAWSSGWVDLGNGILSAAANNVLNINLSFALTAGGVRVSVCGTEE